MPTRVALLALLLLVAGCAHRSSAMPADFAGTVEYANGSVPPPYHFQWRLSFDASTATVEWTPGYEEDGERWRETVDITADQRQRLYDRLRDSGVLDFDERTDEGIAGGSTGSVTLTLDGATHDTGALGTSGVGQDLLQDVVDAVRDLVPADVWAGLEDRQSEWGERQPK
jgi:hypothetical protein